MTLPGRKPVRIACMLAEGPAISFMMNGNIPADPIFGNLISPVSSDPDEKTQNPHTVTP
tara:strand:+ start:24838 stop:25014 length:177 start_codon:yes stop_codon:yes gene_type:complete